MTTLAFSTPADVTIPAGEFKGLGKIEVHQFERIRVAAFVGPQSAGPVDFELTMVEGSVLFRLDTLTLRPGEHITKVYEVPGKKLLISGSATVGEGSSAVGVLIYGLYASGFPT